MQETASLNPVINRALLIGVINRETDADTASGLLLELEELVANLSIGVVGTLMVKIREPSAAYYTGEGKMREILAEVARLEADSIIFDEPLSPAQQRNWETAADGKILVIDRQEIILDIFSRRAQTKEARLQIELARLEYQLPRIKRAWSHLDRQRGGGAVQRDAGETQLEMDQRMIRTRISRLKYELEDVVQRRDVQRRKRQKVPMPTAAIVGYTNAGKSSLMNRLCATADVYAEDQLFATLDPTTRRCQLPSGQTLLLTDTVGFIRRLPHRLVEAFKATLEEALVSDILIHVLDASSPDVSHHHATTRKVLAELGAEHQTTVTVFNKLDACDDAIHLSGLRNEFPDALFLSVRTGEGCDRLLRTCETLINARHSAMELLLPHDRYDLVSQLHEAGAISHSEARNQGVYIRGHIPERFLASVKPYACNGHV